MTDKEFMSLLGEWSKIIEVGSCAKVVKNARDEAIKEFADRLKKEIRDRYFAYEADWKCEALDELVKEMVGDEG